MSTTPRSRTRSRSPCETWCSAPINKLPTELKSMIFLFVVQEAEKDVIPSEQIQIPLALSTVCRRWRAIALSTPHLWNKICVTLRMIKKVEEGKKVLDTQHITSYLELSRTLPLDIHIDARNPMYDFHEYQDGSLDSSPALFNSDHITTALKLLVPHLSRWRMLSIYTDYWEPMYTALRVINEPLLNTGAPLLEKLELMRCNDFASQRELFLYPSLNKHLFLDLRGEVETKDGGKEIKEKKTKKEIEDILPRLGSLILRGVHVHWSSLASILAASTYTGLKNLSLSSHAIEVRPSWSAFHSILKASPQLESLEVVGTCVKLPRLEYNEPHSATEHLVICQPDELPPVDLPQLQKVKLTYRSELQMRVLASLFRAPNATVLDIGFDIWQTSEYGIAANAAPWLEFLGTGKYLPKEHQLLYPPIHDKDAEHISSSDTTCPASRRGSKTAIVGITAPLFPSVSHLILQDVEAESAAFRKFFNSLPDLTHISFCAIGVQTRQSMIHGDREIITLDIDKNRHAHEKALLPLNLHKGAAGKELDAPCKKLQCVSVRNCDPEGDIPYLLDWLHERRKAGASPLSVLELHEASSPSRYEENTHTITFHDGMIVKVFCTRQDLLLEEEDSDEEDEEFTAGLFSEEDEEAEFELGGIFNDPDFDAAHAEYTDWLVRHHSRPDRE